MFSGRNCHFRLLLGTFGYATVFRNIKKLSKLGQKIDFVAHFESFFIYTLVHSMRYTPRTCQLKDLIKMYMW